MEDVQTNSRADIVASHVNGVFIFDLKVGEPVDKAFRQIRKKNYAARSSVINWSPDKVNATKGRLNAM